MINTTNFSALSMNNRIYYNYKNKLIGEFHVPSFIQNNKIKYNDHSDNVQFGGHNIEEGICVGSNVIFNDGSIFSLDGIEQKSLVIDKQILIIDLYNRLNVNNRRN